MRYEPVRRSLALDLLRRLAKRQSLGLGEDIRHQQVVMTPQRIERLSKRNEVARHHSRPLMEQLVERVLAVRSGFAPINGPRLAADGSAVTADAFAAAFHGQLLQVRRE